MRIGKRDRREQTGSRRFAERSDLLRGLASRLPLGQAAVGAAVGEVEHEPYGHPDEEPDPGAGGQEAHEEEAQESRDDGQHGDERCLERPREVWSRPPKNKDPDGDQHEGGERPDVHQLRERRQREPEREDRRDDAGYDRDPVWGSEAGVDPREPQREQVIPAHGEGHPALAEYQDHHDHREPDQDRERDDKLRRREGRHFEGRGCRGRCGQVLVGPEPCKDYGCQDVEDRADAQGAKDTDGYVPLGVARLLGGGGHDVEAYVGEEDQRRRREDAGYAVYGVYPEDARQEVHAEFLPPRLRRRDEGREVRRLYKEYPEAYDENRHEDLDRGD